MGSCLGKIPRENEKFESLRRGLPVASEVESCSSRFPLGEGLAGLQEIHASTVLRDGSEQLGSIVTYGADAICYVVLSPGQRLMPRDRRSDGVGETRRPAWVERAIARVNRRARSETRELSSRSRSSEERHEQRPDDPPRRCHEVGCRYRVTPGASFKSWKRHTDCHKKSGVYHCKVCGVFRSNSAAFRLHCLEDHALPVAELDRVAADALQTRHTLSASREAGLGLFRVNRRRGSPYPEIPEVRGAERGFKRRRSSTPETPPPRPSAPEPPSISPNLPFPVRASRGALCWPLADPNTFRRRDHSDRCSPGGPCYCHGMFRMGLAESD